MGREFQYLKSQTLGELQYPKIYRAFGDQNISFFGNRHQTKRQCPHAAWGSYKVVLCKLAIPAYAAFGDLVPYFLVPLYAVVHDPAVGQFTHSTCERLVDLGSRQEGNSRNSQRKIHMIVGTQNREYP